MDVFRIQINVLDTIPIAHPDHQNSAGAKFCRLCGIALTEQNLIRAQKCSACHHPVLSEDVYCSFCGGELKDSDREENYIVGHVDSDIFTATQQALAIKAANKVNSKKD
jgi:hypothetical protein